MIFCNKVKVWFIEFCNKFGVKLYSIACVVFSSIAIGKYSDFKAYSIISGLFLISGLGPMLTIVFTSESTRKKDQEELDKKREQEELYKKNELEEVVMLKAKKEADIKLYEEIKNKFPYDTKFKIWFESFDHGNSFEDMHLFNLIYLNDDLFKNEVKNFHNKSVDKKYNIFKKALNLYLYKMVNYTSYSSPKRCAVYPTEEEDSDKFWSNVKELNDSAIIVFNTYKNFNLFIVSELHL